MAVSIKWFKWHGTVTRNVTWLIMGVIAHIKATINEIIDKN